MKIKTISLLLLLTVTLGFTASKHTVELYRISGMEKELNDLPLQINQQIAQAKQRDTTLQQLPDEFMKKISNMVHKAFNPAMLKSTILETLEKRMSTSEIKEVLKWYKSTLGRKCNALEEYAGTPTGKQSMMHFMMGLQQNPLPQKRMALIKEFTDALDLKTHMATISINSGAVMMMAFTSSMPADQRPTLEQARAQMQSQIEASMPQIEQGLLLASAFTYQKLSDKEIRSYINFAKSSAGKAYMKASLEAISRAINKGAQQI